jgi:hypothetical protein
MIERQEWIPFLAAKKSDRINRMDRISFPVSG